MSKVYFTEVNTELDARNFIDWLLGIPTPCVVVLNGKLNCTFDQDTDKLYFLTAFEAILNLNA